MDFREQIKESEVKDGEFVTIVDNHFNILVGYAIVKKVTWGKIDVYYFYEKRISMFHTNYEYEPLYDIHLYKPLPKDIEDMKEVMKENGCIWNFETKEKTKVEHEHIEDNIEDILNMYNVEAGI